MSRVKEISTFRVSLRSVEYTETMLWVLAGVAVAFFCFGSLASNPHPPPMPWLLIPYVVLGLSTLPGAGIAIVFARRLRRLQNTGFFSAYSIALTDEGLVVTQPNINPKDRLYAWSDMAEVIPTSRYIRKGLTRGGAEKALLMFRKPTNGTDRAQRRRVRAELRFGAIVPADLGDVIVLPLGLFPSVDTIDLVSQAQTLHANYHTRNRTPQ